MTTALIVVGFWIGLGLLVAGVAWLCGDDRPQSECPDCQAEREALEKLWTDS